MYNIYLLHIKLRLKKLFAGKDGSSSSSSDSEDKEDMKQSLMERKVTNMRRNIREVMSENQLDEETLAAQRQEMERLRRVQEQQRIIREVRKKFKINLLYILGTLNFL